MNLDAAMQQELTARGLTLPCSTAGSAGAGPGAKRSKKEQQEETGGDDGISLSRFARLDT